MRPRTSSPLAAVFFRLSLMASVGTFPALSLADPAGYVEIADPAAFSQIVAVSDVHGMYNRLVTLLRAGKLIDRKNHWIAGRTLLIITGDSIDKGSRSLAVLDLWIQLTEESQAAGGRIIHTLGNHEAEVLYDSDEVTDEVEAELQRIGIDAEKFTAPNNRYGKFLRNQPAIVQIGRWLFFHSGYLPTPNLARLREDLDRTLQGQRYGNEVLAGEDSILEMKDWDRDEDDVETQLRRMDQAGIVGVVFGHQPRAFHQPGRCASARAGRLIKIDNGMSAQGGSHPGSLLVFAKPRELLNSRPPPSIHVIEATGRIHALASTH